MKQVLLLIFFSWLVPFSANAQANYILNPSLEEYTQCPWSVDQIAYAKYWSGMDTLGDVLCTPEYMNECATNINTSVPFNARFYHYPRTGKGMAQVEMYYNGGPNTLPYFRDYLQGRLYKPLSAGASYCVTFYVTLEQASTYALNSIGAYFDDGAIDTHVTDSCAMPQTQYHPQIIDTEIINDTLNWVKIQGSFVASGGEKFITIGNFHDDAHTDTLKVMQGGEGATWYLVDDVSVVAVDLPAFAGNDTAIGKGDTILIGRNELALDCKWYVNNNLIDSGAGIRVHPDTTTTYVVQQNVCGLIKYDTVTVTVWPLGVNSISGSNRFTIYPNPARNSFTVTAPSQVQGRINIYNLVGQEVYASVLSAKQTVTLNVPPGIYIVEVTDDSGSKERKQLVIAQ